MEILNIFTAPRAIAPKVATIKVNADDVIKTLQRDYRRVQQDYTKWYLAVERLGRFETISEEEVDDISLMGMRGVAIYDLTDLKGLTQAQYDDAVNSLDWAQLLQDPITHALQPVYGCLVKLNWQADAA